MVDGVDEVRGDGCEALAEIADVAWVLLPCRPGEAVTTVTSGRLPSKEWRATMKPRV